VRGLETPFSDDFQMLCALITHLGAHEKWQARSPSQVAGRLAMPQDEVERVLGSYPCFFRESTNKNKQGERLFTVHLRYARRVLDPETGSHVSQPMTSDEIGLLIDTLVKMVSMESQESRFVRELQQSNRRQFLTTLGAILVASLTTTATVLVALLK
jgi:hypothetical protein